MMGALEVADLDVRGDLEHDVIAVHLDHRGVHASRGADPGTGRDGPLLLLDLLLATPLRPDHQEVEADEDEHDKDRERQRGFLTIYWPPQRLLQTP